MKRFIKKTLTVFLTGVLSLTAIPLTHIVADEDIQETTVQDSNQGPTILVQQDYGNLTWTEFSEGTATISPKEGTDGIITKQNLYGTILGFTGDITVESGVVFPNDSNGLFLSSQARSLTFKNDTSNITSMNQFFSNMTNLVMLDLGENFDTQNVDSMYKMFANVSSLTTLDLKEKFNTQKVDIMNGMFSGMTSLYSLDFGPLFDTTRSQSNNAYFFSENKALSEVTLSPNIRFTLGMVQFANIGPTNNETEKWFNSEDGSQVYRNFTDLLINYDGTVTNTYLRRNGTSFEVSFLHKNASDELSGPSYRVTHGTVISALSEATIHRTKEGHIFSGWSLNASGSGPYVDIAKTAVTSNMTLYSSWEPNVYTISYDLDGGTIVFANPSKYTYGQGVESLRSPSKLNQEFIGWYDQSGNLVESISKTSNSNLRLIAKYGPVRHVLTFDYNMNRSQIESSYVEPGSTHIIQKNDTVENDGYSFGGWNTNRDGSGTQYKTGDTIQIETSDITLYGQWVPNTYTISYNLDGGTLITPNPTTYTYGQGIVSLKSPSKSGLNFIGWYDQFDNLVESISKTSNTNLELIAKYEQSRYTLTRDYNTTPNSIARTFLAPGSIITLESLDTWKYKGHSFVGWNTEMDGSGTHYNAGDTIEIQRSDITLYGQWNPNTYSITYNLNGGTIATPNPETYTYGVGVASLVAPTKAGHTFVGWYDNKNGTVNNISATEIDDMTMTAVYTINRYTLTRDYNGVVGVRPLEWSVASGGSVILENVTQYSIPGYTFKNWNSKANGSGVSYEGGESLKIIDTNVTVYAQWEPNTYTVSYDLDGGTLNTSNPAEYTFGIGVSSFEAPIKTGYTFVGWSNEADNLVTRIQTTLMGDVKLKAKYTVNTYTIMYDLDGGALSKPNPTEYTFGVGVSTFEVPTKVGHTFTGWHDELDTLITNIPTTSIEGLKLTAKYSVNAYTITYDLDGGTIIKPNPISYLYGIGVSSFEAPTKGGHTFIGWFDELDNLFTDISRIAIGTIRLTAKYTVNTYTITYDLDGGTLSTPNPTTYTYGVGVSSFEAPIKVGYTFTGWYDESDTLITNIPTTSTEGFKLTAKYSVNAYTFMYDLGGGTLSKPNPTEYTFGVGVSTFEAPTKVGHTFTGWHDELDTLVTSIPSTSMSDLKLTAKYTANTYAITYDLDGGILNIPNPETYTYGVGLAAFEAPSKFGYTFVGWVDGSDNPISEISLLAIGDTSVKAIWQINTYTVGFYADGQLLKEITVNYNELIHIQELPAIPSKEGYNSIGWTIENPLARVSSIQLFDVLNDVITQDMRLVAIYELKAPIRPVEPVKPGEEETPTSPEKPIETKNDAVKLPTTGVDNNVMTIGIVIGVIGVLVLLVRKRNKK